MRRIGFAVGTFVLGLTLTACATAPASPVSRPGFYTEMRDGRLWVFREGSKALEEFKQHVSQRSR